MLTRVSVRIGSQVKEEDRGQVSHTVSQTGSPVTSQVNAPQLHANKDVRASVQPLVKVQDCMKVHSLCVSMGDLLMSKESSLSKVGLTRQALPTSLTLVYPALQDLVKLHYDSTCMFLSKPLLYREQLPVSPQFTAAAATAEHAHLVQQ